MGDERMNTTKITEIQRATLEAAALRTDYVAWPIRNGKLNAGSEARVIKRLIAMGLVIEKPAIAKAPVWREDGQGKPLMAVVTEAGLQAIGLLPAGKAGRRSRTAGRKAPVAAKQAAVAGVSPKEPQMPRGGSKLATLVALLGRDEGATIEELVAATGWQAHSVRGVMSGALVKKFGLVVTSEKLEGRGWVYRSTLG